MDNIYKRAEKSGDSTMSLATIARIVLDETSRARKSRIQEIRADESNFFDKLKRGARKPSKEQIQGIEWLSATYDCGMSCILADEMGVGKTMQTIAFLLRLRSRGVNGPFLIVVPLVVLDSWITEIKEWCEAFREDAFTVHRYHGTGRRPPPSSCQIVLTTHNIFGAEYDVISSWIKKWQVVIVDEAHRARNEHTSLSKSLPAIEADMYLLLTGSLIHNNIDAELERLLEIVLPPP